MRKALLLAITSLGLALLFITGCNGGDDNNNRILTGSLTNATIADFSDVNVSLFQNGVLIGTVPVAANGDFTFTGLEDGGNFVVEAVSTTDAFPSTFSRPFSISGDTSITVPVVTTAQLTADFDVSAPAPGTATLVVFPAVSGNAVGATVQIDAETPVSDATPPVVITNVAPQTADVTVSPTGGTPFTVNDVIFADGDIIVIGSPTGNEPETVLVTGQIGSINLTDNFTTALRQNNVLIETGTAAANEPFTFTGVLPGTGFTMEGTSLSDDIRVIYGPFTVPSTDITEPIIFPTKTVDQLVDDGVPTPLPPVDGSATLVVYDGVRVTVDGGPLSPDANPTFVTGIQPGTHAISITNGVQTVQMDITFAANQIVILRPVLPI